MTTDRTTMQQAMIDKSLTLRELHKRTGIDVVRLSRMERDCCGDATPEEAETVAAALSIDTAYLLDRYYRMNATMKQEASDALMKQLEEALKAIRASGQTAGEVPCPRCGKKLFFRVASYNGHIWGKCETKGCLVWMQ